MRIIFDMDGVLVSTLPREEAYKYAEIADVYRTLRPYRKIINVMKILSLHHDVAIVSKTAVEHLCDHHYETERIKKEFAIKHNFGMIPMHVIPASISKREFCLANFGDEPTILIDDYGKNCEDWEKQSTFIAIQYAETGAKDWATAKDSCRLLEVLWEILE